MTDLDNLFDPALLQIDRTNQHADYKGKPIDLTPPLFKMLACIHRKTPRLAKGRDIFQAVWGRRPQNADTSNLYHTRTSLNEALLSHGIEIVNHPRKGFRIRAIPHNVIPANFGQDSRNMADGGQRSIEIFRTWSEAEPILSSVKNSLIIIDSFFSEFGALDRWVRKSLEGGAESLSVSIYMASPENMFGAQRIREKEEPAHVQPTFKDILASEPSDGEKKLYRGLFDRYLREIEQRLSKHAVRLNVYEYPSMLSLRIFVVDDMHFTFGWFPLLDQNPEYPCLYLKDLDLSSAGKGLVEKLRAQIDNLKHISRPVTLGRIRRAADRKE